MKWKKKAAGLFASLQGGQGARRRKYEKKYLSFFLFPFSLSFDREQRPLGFKRVAKAGRERKAHASAEQ